VAYDSHLLALHNERLRTCWWLTGIFFVVIAVVSGIIYLTKRHGRAREPSPVLTNLTLNRKGTDGPTVRLTEEWTAPARYLSPFPVGNG
jgi:hypothetical protein